MRSRQIVALLTGLAAMSFIALADDSKKTPATGRETVAKPMTEKQKKAQEAKLRKELETPYKKWLNEEVVYIISDEERKAFGRLQTDEERQQFIEQFWLRRDPSPDTEENEFREEHYRRIAYANDQFASGVPGWKTDRGRTTTFSSGPRTKKKSTRLVELMTVLSKRAAGPPSTFPVRGNGATDIWKASATISTSNS